MDPSLSDSSDDVDSLDIDKFKTLFQYADPTSFSGIVRCVIADDLQGIKVLIKEGMSPNLTDGHKNTPLHVAVFLNRLAAIDYLLSLEETSINAQNFYGDTALFIGVKYQQVDAVKKLIHARADPNIPNCEYIPPLHMAVVQDDSTLSLLLLQHGDIDIDAQNHNEDTPLNEAVKSGPIETVAMLLYYNADATITSCEPLSPFMNAIIRECAELQDMLIEYETDFNRVTAEGMNVLLLATFHRSPLVEEISRRGGDIHSCDHRSVLEFCVGFHNPELFKMAWERVDYRSCWKDEIKCIVKIAADRGNFHILDYVIHSDKLKTVVASTSERGILVDIFRCVHRGYSIEHAIDAAYILLAAGYSPDEIEVQIVFCYVGYSPLFTLLLYVDVSLNYIPLHCEDCCLLPAIIMRVTDKVDVIVDRFIQTADRAEQNAVMNLIHVVPFLVNRKLFDYVIERDTHNQIGPDIRALLICKFPSLLELCRNAVRVFICLKYSAKKCSQFYTIVNHMNLPLRVKHIINFQVPIYVQHFK